MGIIRKKPRATGIQRGPQREFPSHRAWVRTKACIVGGCQNRDVVAAHYDGMVPPEDMSGMGIKKHDKWCLPLCNRHHNDVHHWGVEKFNKVYGVNLKSTAEECASISPHRFKWLGEAHGNDD